MFHHVREDEEPTHGRDQGDFRAGQSLLVQFARVWRSPPARPLELSEAGCARVEGVAGY